MEKRRSSLYLLAVAIAILVLLAACSGKSSTRDNLPSGSPSPQAPASNDSAKPAKKNELSLAVFDRGIIPESEGTIEKNRWVDYINEHGPANVTIVALPDDTTSKLNTLFASGTAPDLIFEYGLKQDLYNQKQMMPLDDLIEQYSTTYKQMLEENPIMRKIGTRPDGKLYDLVKLNEVNPIRAMFIRADWLEKLNLQIPQTTEELFEVAKAFAERDPDGNGQKDTYGIALSRTNGDVVNMMFENVGWVERDGKLVYGWDSLKEATEFKKRLYDAGVVDKDYLTDSNGAKAAQDFVNGKLGIYMPNISNFLNFVNGDYAALKKNVPDAKIVPIPLPRSPIGQFTVTLENPVQLTAFVNVGTKYPEDVIRLVDFMSSLETTRVLQFGIEGVHVQRTEDGCFKPIDQEKWDREVSWTRDFLMLQSKALDPCAKAEKLFNEDIPLHKEGLELYHATRNIYLDEKYAYPGITHNEHMPVLPKEMALIMTNISKPINDVMVKAIVSGSSFTTEQALAEAKSIWEKGDGAKLEAWYDEWWQNNKDTAFLAKDIFEIVAEQNK
jgi:putative aldouronate transport system substrate-binding protein